MQARNRKDWADYDPAKIPSKTHMPHVEHWLSTLSLPARILDVGCGTGSERGCLVVGVDINRAAIEALSREFRDVREAEFCVRDIASLSGFEFGNMQFDGAVCQLVLSVVGDASDRVQLLKNTREALSPKGKLSVSFSGISDDINPNYAELYVADHPYTGEYGTYLSRYESGRVLYQTHHFAAEEIQKLLQDQGFSEICIEEKIEASSRRPDQRARFYYVTCERDNAKIRKIAMVDARTPPQP
jgi:SAM-dependent methyltransferase